MTGEPSAAALAGKLPERLTRNKQQAVIRGEFKGMMIFQAGIVWREQQAKRSGDHLAFDCCSSRRDRRSSHQRSDAGSTAGDNANTNSVVESAGYDIAFLITPAPSE